MRDRGFKNGMLDEFYLYERVITPSEIQLLAGKTKELTKADKVSIFLDSAYPKSITAQNELFKERKSFGDQRQKLVRSW